MPDYLVDGRWKGDHGISRYSRELLSRLSGISTIESGPPPMHPLDGIWTSWMIGKSHPKAYFTPGFNPPLHCKVKFAFTMHDLTPLHFGGSWKTAKKTFYETVLKSAVKKSARVVTVSQFSRSAIADWARVSPDRIVVIPNACGQQFCPDGSAYSPGFPYLFFVGNQKAHKNVPRMLEAFARSRASRDLTLIMSGSPVPLTTETINRLELQQKVRFAGTITEDELPCYYRGAVALLYPSLYEGFGLPLLESMACGTAVLTSKATALPEVAGGAALLVDPLNVDEIATGIDKIVQDTCIRREMSRLGLLRAAGFSWHESAKKVQHLLFDLAYNS